MKKCPFCAEEVQDNAIFCKYCKSSLDGSENPSSKMITNSSLRQFEEFMRSYGSGWVLINKSKEMLSYQKVTAGSKGSCLVALILLCLAVIPGILYLWFANQPAKTYRLSIALNPDGELIPSGDSEGLKVYNAFIRAS
mgnify:CR=1 FL=1